MAKSYRELDVWQCAIQLSVELYRLTRDFPREKIYGLTSQLRRAGVSVASNIAEGYGRSTKGEYRSFLGMARGSVLEVQTQLVIARELGFGEVSKIEDAEKLADRAGKMLWAMPEKLRSPNAVLNADRRTRNAVFSSRRAFFL
jgi:four helix bundle protein